MAVLDGQDTEKASVCHADHALCLLADGANIVASEAFVSNCISQGVSQKREEGSVACNHERGAVRWDACRVCLGPVGSVPDVTMSAREQGGNRWWSGLSVPPET